MILAVDIGNTNIVIGCIEMEKVYFVERVSTDTAKTELEYVVAFKTLLDLYQIKVEEITGSIIASVVPPLTNVMKSAMNIMVSQLSLLIWEQPLPSAWLMKRKIILEV